MAGVTESCCTITAPLSDIYYGMVKEVPKHSEVIFLEKFCGVGEIGEDPKYRHLVFSTFKAGSAKLLKF